MMNDQMLQLAFSVYKNPGVYALLLGSGVSRAAEIPTGWDVVNDLIIQISAALGEEISGEPTDWFRQRFTEEPGYDTLLKKLGRLSSERNAILRHYFEPTDEERERGTKLPTQAHRAIAWLIKEKYIRVVLTTNFDRLLEIALEEIGVRPDVISTQDQLKGMRPLQHSPCVIVKLHGDYLDGELKNTAEELQVYSPKMNQLLDRVFGEYGLIVCGWSAIWDTALRKAVERTKQRCYSTYWAEYTDQPNEVAQRLTTHRDAQVIAKMSADDFFGNLKDMVSALEGAFRSNPLTVAVAVQHTKKLLSNPSGQIELEEYFRSERERAFETFTSSEFRRRRTERVNAAPDNRTRFENVWELYHGAIELSLNMAVTIAWYGKGDDTRYFTEALERWMELPAVDGQSEKFILWRFLPALALIYVVGMAATCRRNWIYLPAVLQQPKTLSFRTNLETPVMGVISNDLILGGFLRELNLDRFSGQLHNMLRSVFRELIPSEQSYSRVFDTFDMLFALSHIDQQPESKKDWAPGFSTIDDHRSWQYLAGFWEEAARQGKDWAVLRVGLYGAQPNRVQDALMYYVNFARQGRAEFLDYSQIYGNNRPDVLRMGPSPVPER